MDTERNISFFDLLIIILSVYILAALLIDTLFVLPQEVTQLLNYIDNFICIIFLYDFFKKLVKAPSKLKYLKLGWIDLVSSIPNIDILRIGRLARLIRLFRILRAFRSTKYLLTYLFRNRTKAHLRQLQ